MTNPDPKCGRPTSKKRPCRNPASYGPSCESHLTTEERSTLEARRKQAEQERLAALEFDPVCWSWPVTDDHLSRAVDADDITGPSILARWQQYRCATCGSYDSGLDLDHDHATALIRGYLCRSCNRLEAHTGGVFARYRERNPATILGVKARYYSEITGWAKPAEPAWTREQMWANSPLIGIGL